MGYLFCGWKNLLILLLTCILSLRAISQQSDYSAKFEVLPSYTTPGKMPFWFRSNHYGSIPSDNVCLGLIGSVYKEYSKTSPKLLDWGFGTEARVNIGQKSGLQLIEGYGKTRIAMFEVKAGRSKEITGLCDSTLTSGAFAVSGNALGIPKVQVSIPDFYTLPILGKLFAFKGNYAHGWIGKVHVRMLDNTIQPLKTFFHQKSLYGRFGKESWKCKLYGGFSHQVFWGSESTYYGSDYTLTALQDYFYIVTGKPYGTNAIPTSKIGNHLGSIDLGFEYNFKNIRLLAYRQNIYDIGALYYFANIRDGLNGLSLTNTKKTAKNFKWSKILFEIFYTRNQAGELWSPVTPSGDENYYNNDQYIEGWSYQGIGIGNPFISSRTYTRNNLPNDPVDYYINNRVVLFHFGFMGTVERIAYSLKTSYSANYGTFGTSEVGHTLGKLRTLPQYGIFEKTMQFSACLEFKKELRKGTDIGFAAAFDKGDLYYDSFGFFFRIVKSFSIE